MSGRKKIARDVLAALTFLSVLAAIGCGNYSPIAPSQDPPTLLGAANPQFAQLLPASKSPDGPERSSMAAQEISAESGGTVSNGYFSLYFPPGALENDTIISIDMPQYPYAVARLEPHGIKFNKEVILSVPIDVLASDASILNVLWHNEDTGLWENIGGYMEDGAVKAGLKHFSDYGFER